MARIPVKRGGRSRYTQTEILNPGKGLNNLISDNLIDDKEASSLENIMFVESGAPSKAYGFTSVGTGLTNNPRGLAFFNDTQAGNRDLLTVDGTSLMYLNSSTWTAISGATFSSSAQINFTQALGDLYVWDGTSGGAKLATGRTLTRPGTLPKAKFSIFYGGYHWCAGVDGQLSRLYRSVLTDAADFTNDPSVTDPTPDNSTDVPGATVFAGTGSGSTIAQFVDVSKNDGDKITGLAKFQDALIIFKERSIFQLTLAADGTPTVVAVSKSYGCVSHRSIDNVDNDVFFLTRNGVYVLGNEPNYYNAIRTNELSSRIHPTIETINPTSYSLATALFSQYVYYLGIPSGGVTANNMTLSYDRRFLAWSKLTHIAPECFSVYTDTTNTDTIYFTSASTNKVYKFTTNYDANDDAISAQWTSKAFDLGDFSQYKRFIFIDILFRQLVGTVSIDIYTDNGTLQKSTSISSSQSGGMGSNQIGGGDWIGGTVSTGSTGSSSVSSNIPYRIKINSKSRSIKVKVSNDRVNETFVILGLKIYSRPYSPFVFPSSQKIS